MQQDCYGMLLTLASVYQGDKGRKMFGPLRQPMSSPAVTFTCSVKMTIPGAGEVVVEGQGETDKEAKQAASRKLLEEQQMQAFLGSALGQALARSAGVPESIISTAASAAAIAAASGSSPLALQLPPDPFAATSTSPAPSSAAAAAAALVAAVAPPEAQAQAAAAAAAGVPGAGAGSAVGAPGTPGEASAAAALMGSAKKDLHEMVVWLGNKSHRMLVAMALALPRDEPITRQRMTVGVPAGTGEGSPFQASLMAKFLLEISFDNVPFPGQGGQLYKATATAHVLGEDGPGSGRFRPCPFSAASELMPSKKAAENAAAHALVHGPEAPWELRRMHELWLACK